MHFYFQFYYDASKLVYISRLLNLKQKLIKQSLGLQLNFLYMYLVKELRHKGEICISFLFYYLFDQLYFDVTRAPHKRSESILV